MVAFLHMNERFFFNLRKQKIPPRDYRFLKSFLLFLPMCIFVYLRMHAHTCECRYIHGIPGAWSNGHLRAAPHGCWEQNSSPQLEQNTLLAVEPSLQLQTSFIFLSYILSDIGTSYHGGKLISTPSAQQHLKVLDSHCSSFSIRSFSL